LGERGPNFPGMGKAPLAGGTGIKIGKPRCGETAHVSERSAFVLSNSAGEGRFPMGGRGGGAGKIRWKKRGGTGADRRGCAPWPVALGSRDAGRAGKSVRFRNGVGTGGERLTLKIFFGRQTTGGAGFVGPKKGAERAGGGNLYRDPHQKCHPLFFVPNLFWAASLFEKKKQQKTGGPAGAFVQGWGVSARGLSNSLPKKKRFRNLSFHTGHPSFFPAGGSGGPGEWNLFGRPPRGPPGGPL